MKHLEGQQIGWSRIRSSKGSQHVDQTSHVYHYVVNGGSQCLYPEFSSSIPSIPKMAGMRGRTRGGGVQRPVRVYQLEKEGTWTSGGSSCEW